MYTQESVIVTEKAEHCRVFFYRFKLIYDALTLISKHIFFIAGLKCRSTLQNFIYKILHPSLSLFILLLLSLGCQSIDKKQDLIAPPPQQELKVTLGLGDEIEVKFFYVPELNETQNVRTDGKISLQLVGEVMAQGKTPVELKNELIKLYSSELKNPEIAVIVRLSRKERIYVGGAVRVPGMYEIHRSITALEAIMEAGGHIAETADLKEVVIIRNNNGQISKEVINLKKALEGEESPSVVYLQPLDTVYVPETRITKYNRWVDQYINRVVPFGTTITTTRGRTTMGVDPSD